jgi:acetylglutamate kinase
MLECEPLRRGAAAGGNGAEGAAGADLGYVGDVIRVDCGALNLISNDAYIPVVAPIGVGKDGHSYNINADTAAAKIAAALKAEKLILLTDVDGIKESPDSAEPIAVLTSEEVHGLIERKVICMGMIPKALGCLEAIEAGVGRTHIIDGRMPHCILLEIFTNKGIGTMILKEKVPYFIAERI